MVKKFIPAISMILLLGSCSALKQIDFSGNKQIVPTTSTATVQDPPPQKNKEVKFLDNISASTTQTAKQTIPTKQAKGPQRDEVVVPKPVEQPGPSGDVSGKENELENESSSAAFALQTKYATMLNTDPSQIQNVKLYEYIDDWYGTPYRLGGTTKNGVDCSAFVQSLFAMVYGVTLPRTSKYQYTSTKRISTTELKEGDLLFFHTRRNIRGVTHVGIYLQNNKFVQASSSGGVTISDMYDPYYVKHLVGAGRAIAVN
jgi:lipoprotein Spr